MLEYYSAEDPNSVNVRAAERNLYSSDLSDFYVLAQEEYERSGIEHPQVYGFNQMARKLARIVLGDSFQGDRW
jgi:hypothetical protein